MLERFLTGIEEELLGKTWTMGSMTFRQRLRFFRDTGEWPGTHLRETTALTL
ncbi:MAG: hypothetical protein UX19_C0003G0005 [Candidatus Woesebacteria bacterium GW2011_GWA1_45_8]|uniref:Uncharacterized protein n=1 Tax=Candidatus Woesebacteria bacterium GW2011_GWA1_45_8 TaxID=1618559 RepID=A0A0G1QUD6_9BACT|nr:MAG: hypothetical protein UX19_C0003G0005 [Candidatus Woesebacteria bacterium GW2011_GWA1_45_8]